MAETINWTVDIQVSGGPRISQSRRLLVEAYDKIDVEVPAAEPVAAAPGTFTPGRADVQVQPGGAGQVQFLVISSSVYSDQLVYRVNTPTAPVPPPPVVPGPTTTGVPLDELQLLIGTGAVGLLAEPPQTLYFSNRIWDAALNQGQIASIQIFVGRDATLIP